VPLQRPVKAAFVYVTPVLDAGWTTQHDAGRRQLQTQLGDQVQTTVVADVAEGSDAERVIRDLAANGNDIIFTTSFGYMEPTMRVARDFPQVKFESITGYQRAANVATANARYYEGRYLSGIAAARLSQTGVAGFVAGFPIPEVIQGINAFVLGMRSVNPKAQVKVVWLNAWFDPPREREAAMALMNEGADVLSFQVASTAVMGAAQERGKMAIAFHSDMRKAGPQAQLLAVTHQWGGYDTARVRALQKGEWKSQDTWGGVREGMIRVDSFGPRVPKDVRMEVQQRQDEMAHGKLHAFRAGAAPIRDNLGQVRIPAGSTLPDADILQMNWLAEGVVGQLPR
jgi:simple sugar transport system substrate-binding protein